MLARQLTVVQGWRGAILATLLVLGSLVGCGAPPSSPTVAPTPDPTVTGETWMAQMVGCLRQAGWDVVLAPAGDSYQLPNLSGEQRPAFIEADAACQEQVGPPPAPEELSEAEIREHYRFLLDARQCLVDLGYSISDPPSEDAFVESWTTGPWSPFNEVVEVVSPEEWARINEECPQS